MLHAAMDEAGVGTNDAVMIGDTRFDAQMAHAARMPFLGVGWGYHEPSQLDGARAILDDFSELDEALNALWADRHE